MRQKIEETLSNHLSQHRYEHSLRVATLSQQLAVKHHCDSDKAYLAALIHDAAKEMNPKSSPIHFSDQERTIFKEYPKVWHALVLPSIAPLLFGELEDNILEAAKWHSTGSAKMSLLAKCVYVADAVEPGRNYAERADLEQLAFNNLDACVFEIAAFTIQKLSEQKEKIHPETLACYNYYQQ